MDSRKKLSLLLFIFISFVLFAGSISYGDVGVPEVKKPSQKVDVEPQRRQAPQVPAATVDSSYADLLNRIEALESRSVGNVSAPKVRGLKISGHIRTRFEANSNFMSNKGSAPTRDGNTDNFTRTLTSPLGIGGLSGNKSVGVLRHENYVVQRVRLAFDADINKNARAHVMIDGNRTFGGDQNTIQGNRTDRTSGDKYSTNTTASIKQAYFELRNLGDISSILENVTLMVGRKQWAYGDQRLIGHLNWTNVGRTHDGMVARWKIGGGKSWIDAFMSQVGVSGTDDAGPGQAIKQANQDVYLYGLYSHFVNPFGLEGILAEPYLFINDKDNSAVDGDDGSNRWFGGMRLVGKKIPGLPGLDFTVEPTWQWGDQELATANKTSTTVPLQAFGIGAKAGYTFKNIPWTPRIGYEFVFASGDDKPGNSNTAGSSKKTFDQLYPLGHAHLGYMDVHGYMNIEAHAIRLSAKPTKKLLLKADLWFFSADEEADSFYNVAGGTGRFGADRVTSQENGITQTINVDDEYGQELDLVAKYKLFKNVGVVGGYSHYFTGDFLEDTNHGVAPGMDWVWLQAAVKF